MRLKSGKINYEAYPAKLIDDDLHFCLFLAGVGYLAFVVGLIIGVVCL